MQSSLEIFKYNDHDIRIYVANKKPWSKGTDICKIQEAK